MNPFFRIRWKLLILLLSIALVPLVVGSVLQRRWARQQGSRLATDQRQILIRDAEMTLQRVVDDYARMLAQSGNVMEMLINTQAREIERALAGPVPQLAPDQQAVPVSRIDAGDIPAGIVRMASKDFEGWDPEGMLRPQLILLDNFSVLHFQNADVAQLSGDVARVAQTADELNALRLAWPGLLLWQHTTLSEGAHLCLPGHGGYSPSYDARQREWYIETIKNDAVTWTPVADATTGRIMLTLSTPIRVDGTVVGVTSLDVPLSALIGMLHMPNEWRGDATLILVSVQEDGSLSIIAESSDEDVSHLAWKVRPLESEHPEFAALQADAQASVGGVRFFEHEGEDFFWAYGPSLDRAFPLILLPQDVIDGPADEAEVFVTQQIARGLQVTGLILLIVVGVVTVVAVVSSGSITRPIRRLVDATDRLRKGDFEVRVEIRSRDELGELGDTFNAMVPQLLENQELRKSLEVAMEIQQQLLPDCSPQVPGLDIFGQAVYCDETGGDYYDFLLMGETRLGVALGDITGHGIGAALLMASARGVLRSRAEEFGEDLVGFFEVLNRHLVRDTGAGRFLTLFYAVLDSTDGERRLTSISAGHDPAMWLRADGTVEELPNNGIPLGIVDDFPYTANESIVIAPGEVVLVGTDGIWEAMNAGGEMFGKERLKQLLKTHGDKSAEKINREVVVAVLEFIGTAPRTDDITLTVIRAV